MAHNIDEFWKILKSIQGESTDLTEAIDAIAKNEKTTSQRLMDLVIDQIAHNSPDWARLKGFFRDWYAAHRTVTTFQANISDVYEIPNDQLDELFRSFGYDLSAVLKNPINNESPAEKINLFLELVNLYKRKGTPQALLEVLQYYGIISVDIYELQLQFEERERKNPTDLIFKGKLTTGTSNISPPIYLPFNYLTDKDPHWLQTEAQIKRLVSENKINFPSQSPYFVVKPLFDEESINPGTGMLIRNIQDQHDTWDNAGQPDEGLIAVLPQDAVMTITGEIVSLLTLYLSTIYVFNKEFDVGAPGDRFLCYDGTNTDPVIIMDEFRTLTQRASTRSQWKAQLELYLDTFSRVTTTNFLQNHDDAGDVLSILNPAVKANLDGLATDNITILGTLLRDLGEWVRNNISFGFINMSYILFGLDSFFAELSNVIEFFKPYRARMIPLETIEFTNRLFNSIIVEDKFLMDIEENVHDYLTGDSIPCCDSTTCINVDTTSTDLFYSRETYDCGSYHDIGAVTDMPREMFIEIQDDIHDELRCPRFCGDGTAAIQIASNLGSPNAPIVTSELLNYIPLDITDIVAGDNTVVGTFAEVQSPGYALTINMFNEDDSSPSIYSHIITEKSMYGFTALFSDVMDSANYSVSYDYDNSDNSGIINVPDGTSVITVNIPPPPEIIDDTSYTVALSLSNTVDVNPSLYNYSVIERTATYFTVQFSGEMDSSNYYLEWILITHEKQDVLPLMEGWTSVTIPLNPFEVNDRYGLSIVMLNTVDTTSSIIPFIVTDKSIDGFTVMFDSPIDSPNYQLMWSRPLGASLSSKEYNYYQTGGFTNFDGVPVFDSTAYVYVEGTQGRFDCTHGFDLVQIEIEDITEYLLQENGSYILQEDGSRILL